MEITEAEKNNKKTKTRQVYKSKSEMNFFFVMGEIITPKVFHTKKKQKNKTKKNKTKAKVKVMLITSFDVRGINSKFLTLIFCINQQVYEKILWVYAAREETRMVEGQIVAALSWQYTCTQRHESWKVSDREKYHRTWATSLFTWPYSV